MRKMMGDKPLSNDREVINNGRTKTLTCVDAPMREQVVKKLRQKLVDLDYGVKLTNVWFLGNADRAKYLERQRAFLAEFDEFIEEIYDPGVDWGSALHIPTSLTVCKTYHARMQSAVLGINPPFTVKARKAANA